MMATPTRVIILIIACACLVDSRFLRGSFNKQRRSPADHHITEANSEDPDAVIFPYDEEAIVFERANKNIDAAEIDKHGDDKDSKTDNDLEVKNVPLPLISKVLPEKEIKDVFNNPIESEDTETGTGKISDFKEPVIDTTEVKLVPNEPLPDTDIQENKTIQEEPEIKLNDTIARNNDIVPDLSSRFGVTGNYMLVPVAANVQGYQPIQTNQNAIPVSTMQGSLPFQTQVPTELNTNAINPQHVANAGSNLNYTPNVNYPMQMANVGTDVQHVTPNIGSNVLYTPNTGSNIGSHYVAPNYGNSNQANAQVNGNTYVPVSVPNTYLINGQLYAAVTVPSNQVPSSLYYVNPQVSSYQVPNNVPLYKLVSMSDGGSQVVNGNTQFVPNNQNQ